MSLARASSSLAGRTITIRILMKIKGELLQRSSNKCEICGNEENLDIYKVEPKDEYIVVCDICKPQLDNPKALDPNHFRCLNESMWSEIPAVQVVSYRLLTQMQDEGWPRELLDMLYLDDETKEWAESLLTKEDDKTIPTKDSNGNILNSGDSVSIIKDLEVKGAGFTAKRGTVVKNIVLTDNPEQIEGRVNGTRIVLLSKFLKKV